MTKNDIPNTPGDYMIDGVSIIVLPDKIKIDTGDRQRSRKADNDDDDDSGSRKKGGKKTEKKGDFVNDILDNAQDFLIHGIRDRKK